MQHSRPMRSQMYLHCQRFGPHLLLYVQQIVNLREVSLIPHSQDSTIWMQPVPPLGSRCWVCFISSQCEHASFPPFFVSLGQHSALEVDLSGHCIHRFGFCISWALSSFLGSVLCPADWLTKPFYLSGLAFAFCGALSGWHVVYICK